MPCHVGCFSNNVIPIHCCNHDHPVTLYIPVEDLLHPTPPTTAHLGHAPYDSPSKHSTRALNPTQPDPNRFSTPTESMCYIRCISTTLYLRNNPTAVTFCCSAPSSR
ncbi:hypothetical protein L798_07510 [Zootermopsis nevadensis]|uniref:Uncharacterized protein n=1 Tax=Zootermopsis nevadensis TaxID=136037 RepID=A0A067R5T2_ZOONE|nr:hypothetical protein L798_07510 [Zootermopsis nevadensis]